MSQDRFENINIGDEEEIFHTITAKDVDAFACLTGDNNPLHMDDEFAAKTTFKKRVVHGMLPASFISTMIGTKLPGEGSLWYEQKLRFISPVRIGERIRVFAKVKFKSLSQRVLTIETTVFGEGNKKVIEGEAKVKVLELQKEENKVMGNNEKVAVIVTGASRGIGAATASELASEGYAVIVNYLNSSTQADEVVMQITEAGGRAAVFQADVAAQDAVENMVAFALMKYGAIAGVVNNASPSANNKDSASLSWEDIQHHLDVHVKGAFNLCHAVMPRFLEQGYGCVVNIASIFADNVPPSQLLPYSLAKSALVSLSRSLAVEYGPKNIRVNCISPGMTQTDLIADLPEKVKMVTKAQTPLRRLATPKDIAGTISFLFSEKARHITGETIRVCGGIVMV